MEEIKNLLLRKFEEIQRRILLVLEQLSDEEVNWRPNESSNSIANLIVHISGNVNERIIKGIHKKGINRNRDEEFEDLCRTKQELMDITNESFNEVIETITSITKEAWLKTQMVRNKERTHLDMLIQCATHFSEHMGQILYIGKIIKNSEYVMTSIPKKNNRS
ncbi:MAG: DinB family protein [Bacillota bacterium]